MLDFSTDVAPEPRSNVESTCIRLGEWEERLWNEPDLFWKLYIC